MRILTKQHIACLLTILAFLATSSAVAQSWVFGNGQTLGNVCGGNGYSGTCQCPQGYSSADASITGENCNDYTGCWNPTGSSSGGGACFTCGSGGTVKLGSYSCFGGSDGQQNIGGSAPGFPVSGAVSCSSNSDCIPWNNNATSGGFAQ